MPAKLSRAQMILTIAKTNNISHAAERLFMSQSALNQQLLNMEREIGTNIFNRTRNNWTLTDAGKIYVDYAEKATALENETYSRIADLVNSENKSLRVGIMAGYGTSMFCYCFYNFHERYPDITVHPVEKDIEYLKEMLQTGELDIAFLVEGGETMSFLSETCLMQHKFYVYAHEDCTFSRRMGDRNVITCEDLPALSEERFVIPRQGNASRDLLESAFAKQNLSLEIVMETNNAEIHRTMLKSGLGVILSVADAIMDMDGLRVRRFDSDPPFTSRVSAVYKSNRYLSIPARNFLKIAVEYMGTSDEQLKKMGFL